MENTNSSQMEAIDERGTKTKKQKANQQKGPSALVNQQADSDNSEEQVDINDAQNEDDPQNHAEFMNLDDNTSEQSDQQTFTVAANRSLSKPSKFKRQVAAQKAVPENIQKKTVR